MSSASNSSNQHPPRIKASPSLSRPSTTTHHPPSSGGWNNNNNNNYDYGAHTPGRSDHSEFGGRGNQWARRGGAKSRGKRNLHWVSPEYNGGRAQGGRGHHHNHHNHHGHHGSSYYGASDNANFGDDFVPGRSVGARSPPPPFPRVGGVETDNVNSDYSRRFYDRGGGNGGGGGGGDGGGGKRPAPPESALSPEDRRPTVRPRGRPGEPQSSDRDGLLEGGSTLGEQRSGGDHGDSGGGGGRRSDAGPRGGRGHNSRSSGRDESGDGYDGSGTGRRGSGNSAKAVRQQDKKSKSRRSGGGSGSKSDGGGGGGSREEKGVLIGNSVFQRREVKLKELKVLHKKREAAIAAGEALTKSVNKNRMEQEEIAIQIDAAKRFLALYDSNRPSSSSSASAAAVTAPAEDTRSTARSTAQASTPPPPPRRSSSSTTTPNTTIINNGASAAAAISSMPAHSSSSSSRSRDSSQQLRPPPPPPSPYGGGTSSSSPGQARVVGVPPEKSTPPPVAPPLVSSSSASRVRSSSESTGTRGGRGGTAATVRGRGSGSRMLSSSSSSALSPSSGALGSASSSSANGLRKAEAERGAGTGKVSGRKGGGAAPLAAARSVVSVKHNGGDNNTSSSSSSSGEDDDDVVGGVGRNGKSLYGFITSMPPAGGGGAAPAGGGGAEAPRRTGKSSGDGSRRGVEVNAGSFNVKKQLMFKTTRTHRARAMAFNPVVKDVFAVCSADLSVDLWRYSKRNHELEKLSERADVTPIGGAHMAWNPSGTHLAIGHTGSTLVDHWAATIVARQGLDTFKLRSLKHTRPAQAVAWVTPSKNNQDHLVTGGEDGLVVIWTRVLDVKSDLHKVAILHSRHSSAVRSACCPSISPTVVTGGADGRLVSYSIETASVQWEELLRVTNTYHPSVNELLEFPDNPCSLLVSAVDTGRSHVMFTMDTRQNTSRIHSAKRMEWKRKDPAKPFSSFVYPSISPCGRYVACAGDWNGCFHLWDVRADRTDPMQSVLVNSSARVVHTAWHPSADARALMSLSAANGGQGKNFALHLHAGLRSS